MQLLNFFITPIKLLLQLVTIIIYADKFIHNEKFSKIDK
ncbi:hypothetical protein A1OE_1213 [Candidatus Endolissoclinum faulkneri L2]|uniref:Uncharacterized protein n=1 Tax=Candidatus Endolissoclinum faulkneri L2 TaxID=1193729 RepID=K7YS67_9PROT|nr:hypothetical protein A1OE_1213 [Candidatus Endolissoclinum faulkneri L2]